LTISPQRFEVQMRWLAAHGYVGISPSAWFQRRRDGKALPDRPVLITLDDGYADIAEYALPAICHRGFSAAVYVVTGQIGGSDACWQRARGRSGSHRLMDAHQIRYWADQGIEFGAHSRTHPDLTTLSGDRLAEEVEGSSEDLARILGTRPASFAYPYGIYNQKIRDRVARGFDLALSCEAGSNRLTTDPYVLRRVEIMPNHGMIGFACRVRLGGLPAQLMRQSLRARAHRAVRGLRASAGIR